ncbi:MAG: PIN domain-containing protein [Candidatus Poribacteria bacterium]|nr:PIN domain-containing protein [Candidatus Poribacteria bacterium]
MTIYKIYLDSCCVSRPYDNQTQNRIKSETTAIMQIISRFWNGEWQSVTSTVLQFEINQISDLAKRSFVKGLFTSIPQIIFVSVGASETFRGKQLEALGFKEYDALHIACAETGKADVFLTTDDAVIRRAKRLGSQLRIRVENPDTWLQEQTNSKGGN